MTLRGEEQIVKATPGIPESAGATVQVPESSQREKVRLVRLKDAHGDGVNKLYRQVFGDHAALVYQERLAWTFQSNLIAVPTLGWVLEHGEMVVGFLAALPMRYYIAGEEIIAYTPADYMVHPDYRFHGIKLMKEFFDTCDNCVTADDMAATLKVLEWMGARDSGSFLRYRKLLDGRALSSRGLLGSVPSFLWWPLNQVLSLRDRILKRTKAPGVTITHQDHADDRFTRFSKLLAAEHAAMPVRDTVFFDWRYGVNSPQRHPHIGVATNDNGDMLGYVIYSYTRGPKHISYVLDLQTGLGVDEVVANSLLEYAVNKLRRSGAWSVRYYQFGADSTVTSKLLRHHDFSPSRGYRLMTRFKNENHAKIAGIQANWNFSFGDSESSYTLE